MNTTWCLEHYNPALIRRWGIRYSSPPGIIPKNKQSLVNTNKKTNQWKQNGNNQRKEKLTIRIRHVVVVHSYQTILKYN